MFHKRVARTARYALMMISALLFVSCFGIEMKTVFNADGSGRMTMKFRVSQMLLEMGEEEAGVDVPLSKEDLTSQYEDLEGVTVVEVTEEDTEEDRIITAIIDFDDFNALSSEEDLPGEDASLELEDGKSVLRILIGPPAEEPLAAETEDEGSPAAGEMGQPPSMEEMDESMMAMMQSFMEGYYMEYTIVAPKKIISYSHGELEKDGRTLVHGMPMGDFIMIEEPYYLEIVW